MSALLKFALLLLCLLGTAVPATLARKQSSVDAKVEELIAMAAKSRDGVVEMDDRAWSRFAHGKQRPYSLVVFCNAGSDVVKSPLVRERLDHLRKEMGYVSKAYRDQHREGVTRGKVFFAHIHLSHASSAFAQLGISALPAVIHIAPSANLKGGSRYTTPADDDMKASAPDHGLWTADDFADFVRQRTGVSAAVVRPSIFRSWWWPFFAVGFLGVVAYVGVKIYLSPIVRFLPLWILGALALYTFSVGGGLYNIIRGIPLVGRNNEGKAEYFVRGGHMQWGAEGFLMALHYLIFSLPLMGMWAVATKVPSPTTRRVLAYALLFLSWFGFRQGFGNLNWKTGYAPRWFVDIPVLRAMLPF
ncbi:unnamed protein product [Pedinophyceae sp. YPF-701]|nr:unnamed protein product [Pedinophyceae sp. YPF-701]